MKTHKADDDDDDDGGHFCGSKAHQSAWPAAGPSRRSNPITIAVQIRRPPPRWRTTTARAGAAGRRSVGRPRLGAHRAHRDGINHGDARDGKSRPIVAMATGISGRDGCSRGGSGLARWSAVRPPGNWGRRPGGCGRPRTVYTTALDRSRASELRRSTENF